MNPLITLSPRVHSARYRSRMSVLSERTPRRVPIWPGVLAGLAMGALIFVFGGLYTNSQGGGSAAWGLAWLKLLLSWLSGPWLSAYVTRRHSDRYFAGRHDDRADGHASDTS